MRRGRRSSIMIYVQPERKTQDSEGANFLRFRSSYLACFPTTKVQDDVAGVNDLAVRGAEAVQGPPLKLASLRAVRGLALPQFCPPGPPPMVAALPGPCADTTSSSSAANADDPRTQLGLGERQLGAVLYKSALGPDLKNLSHCQPH